MKTNVPKLLLLICLFLLLLALTGCFPGSQRYTYDSPAGFFTGVWHGWIAPISLIVGFFSDHVRIYEPHNTGWWYDFGYYIAVIAGFGGVALRRKDKHKEGK